MFIAIPYRAHATALRPTASQPLRIQAKLIELSGHQATVIDGQGAWQVAGEVGRAQSGEQDTTTSEIPHEDITLARPCFDVCIPEIAYQEGVRLYFDGGARKTGVGYGGFLAWTSAGICLGGAGHYYGTDAPTNNEAEAHALTDSLEWMLSMLGDTGGRNLIMHGDSALVIAFMQRRYKPGKPALVRAVTTARRLVANHRNIRAYFVHVPRT